ncbi:hypothetical protein KYC5002_13995 [Archangium violaceum]|uniref:hypothetical protein n=1 Tax=Archangium violaceum TaxID=83451 RepID=UPI002B2E19D9|nr:hypothetical protein KYC5002_13995 [Archangium gephyra]
MTEWKSATTPVDFRELDISELAGVRGGYTSEVMLNPQPLPPRAPRYLSSWSWVMLNPQPEPPGILFSLGVSLQEGHPHHSTGMEHGEKKTNTQCPKKVRPASSGLHVTRRNRFSPCGNNNT